MKLGLGLQWGFQYMVGMPGFCGQIFEEIFDPGFLDRKYSVQCYWDGKLQFYKFTGAAKT